MIAKATRSMEAAYPARRRKSRQFDRRILPYLMLLPALLILTIVIVGPTLYAIVMSFHSWDLTNPAAGQKFIGLQNYQTLLSDQYFWDAIKTAGIFAIGACAIEILLGLGMSLLLTELRFLKNIVNAAILIPLMITPVVVGLIWHYMFDPSKRDDLLPSQFYSGWKPLWRPYIHWNRSFLHNDRRYLGNDAFCYPGSPGRSLCSTG